MEVKLQNLRIPLAKEACDSTVQAGQTCPFGNIVSISGAPAHLLDLPVHHFIGELAIFLPCVQEADVHMHVCISDRCLTEENSRMRKAAEV